MRAPLPDRGTAGQGGRASPGMGTQTCPAHTAILHCTGRQQAASAGGCGMNGSFHGGLGCAKSEIRRRADHR